jgi:hypothetical protein
MYLKRDGEFGHSDAFVAVSASNTCAGRSSSLEVAEDLGR